MSFQNSKIQSARALYVGLFCFWGMLVGCSLEARQPGLQNFQRLKFGIFVHYVWGGSAYPATINPDGTLPAGLDDLADRFDAQKFAADLKSVGAEYVIFTAWHANMNCLWPSAVMNRWLPGHASRRDVIGDMIKTVRAEGIRVILYTHPTDGHDLNATEQIATGWNTSSNSTRWNDFINELYAELIVRYGCEIDGVYLDEHFGRNGELLDYPRLRATLKAGNPDFLMIQNDYGRRYNADLGHEELFKLPSTDSETWPALQRPSALLFSQQWWASVPETVYAPKFSAESIFRYIVMKAGVTTAGGVAWSLGNYPDGRWERGVMETLRLVHAHLEPISCAIKNTYTSTSYPTPVGATIRGLEWGVATRSVDDRREFLHVLNPPVGRTLRLPPPADGKQFKSARLLPSGRKVALVQNTAGLKLTLSPRDSWELLDTVIELEVAKKKIALPVANASTKSMGGDVSVIAVDRTITATNSLGEVVKLSPTPGMTRWFDASVLRLKSNAPVIRWDDLSGHEAHAVRPLGENRLPVLVSDASTGTGLGAVHFGPGQGMNPALNSHALMFRPASQIRTVVSVFKGSSFLLTDFGAIHFHRPDDTNSAAPLWSSRDASQHVLGGTTYVNGARVDGSESPLPADQHNGFNLITVITTNTVTASSFNRDRDCHAGDQYHAEVLLYDFPLTESQRLETEAYLRAKWFGEPPPASRLK